MLFALFSHYGNFSVLTRACVFFFILYALLAVFRRLLLGVTCLLRLLILTFLDFSFNLFYVTVGKNDRTTM